MPTQSPVNTQNLDIFCFFNEMLENPEEVKIQYAGDGEVQIISDKLSTKLFFEAFIASKGVISLIRFIRFGDGEWLKSGSCSCVFDAATLKWSYVDGKSKVEDLHLKYLPALYRITNEIKQGLQKYIEQLDYVLLGCS